MSLLRGEGGRGGDVISPGRFFDVLGNRVTDRLLKVVKEKKRRRKESDTHYKRTIRLLNVSDVPDVYSRRT